MIVYMANQITHIVYADTVRRKFLADKQIDEAKFYVGNMFPDIRVLASITRTETHSDNPTVEEMLKIENSFEIGAYCHVLIDREREKVLKRLNFYDLFPEKRLLKYAMKFIEDEITYSRIKNWPEIISYFDVVFDEETKLVPQKFVLKWHDLIRAYFTEPPNRKTVNNLLTGIGMDINIIESIFKIMEEIKRKPEALKLIEITQEKLFNLETPKPK